MIKSYTDIKQSKKLAEILPLKSADMYWDYNYSIYTCHTWKYEYHPMVMDDKFDDVCIPAWSLAALLGVLPNSIYDNTNEFSQLEFTKKSVAYIHGTTGSIKIGALRDNLIDACYELILELHELKML